VVHGHAVNTSNCGISLSRELVIFKLTNANRLHGIAADMEESTPRGSLPKERRSVYRVWSWINEPRIIMRLLFPVVGLKTHIGTSSPVIMNPDRNAGVLQTGEDARVVLTISE
jgi:hypothetical protein